MNKHSEPENKVEMPNARIPYEKCPLCDHANSVDEMTADCSHHPLYKPVLPATQKWLRCCQCDHIYVDGYFSAPALAALFSSSLSYQTPGHEIEKARSVSAGMVQAVCERLTVPGRRWLDIGFGNGALMTTAAEYGFHTVGLDLREANVTLMAEFGFEVYEVEFEDYVPDELFNVISMADVLEHMPFPKQALRHAHTLLAEGGLLFLSMPNADAFVWSFFSRQGINPFWGELEHYHNFGRRRLYELLAECGFEPIHYGVSSRYRLCMEVVARKSEPLRS